MSAWEIIVVFAVIPAAIVLVLAVLTVGVGWHRTKVRYEPGGAWDHPDQLWAGQSPVVKAPSELRMGTRRGEAHANW